MMQKQNLVLLKQTKTKLVRLVAWILEKFVLHLLIFAKETNILYMKIIYVLQIVFKTPLFLLIKTEFLLLKIFYSSRNLIYFAVKDFNCHEDKLIVSQWLILFEEVTFSTFDIFYNFQNRILNRVLLTSD